MKLLLPMRIVVIISRICVRDQSVKILDEEMPIPIKLSIYHQVEEQAIDSSLVTND